MNDKQGAGQDMRHFLKNVKVDTSNKIKCVGRVTLDKRPTHMAFRLPEEQAEWIREQFPRNANYAVSRMLAFAITELKERLTQGDTDIDHL